jgi:hypothetical protein
MKSKRTFFAALAAAAVGAVVLGAGSASGAIVINEIDSDTFNPPGGTADYAEFIELYSTTGATTSLSDLTVVLFNGNGDVAYAVLDLDGQSTDENGYYLIGTNSVAGADNTSLLGGGNILQNGADAVAIYTGDFASGGGATGTNLVDAIVYGTADPDDSGLRGALGQGVQYDEGSGTPPSDAANGTLARFPNSTSGFVQALPTPGGANAVPEPGAVGLLVAAAGLLAGRRRRGA